MKKRNIKKKKKFSKIKFLFYFLITYFSYNYTFYYLMNNNINNEEFLKMMLSDTNHNMIYDYKPAQLVNQTIKLVSNIDITKPSSILSLTKINESFLNRDNDDYSNLEELQKITEHISDPTNQVIDNPIVYLYNSHQLENYSMKHLEIYNIRPNVMMTSYILREKLNNLGIKTIVEEANFTEFLNLNNYDYSFSYKVSRHFMEEAKNINSTLKYYIDIHRDSVNHNASTINIDNLSCVKVLFVVGLEHKTYKSNLKAAKILSNKINQKYPGLSKGILEKKGSGVNGIYNQDFSARAILIEFGGVDNTIDEVKNTIDLIGPIIRDYIEEDPNE